MVQIYTIQPTGLLNGATANQFQDSVEQALAQDAQLILIDCQALTFMDSSGLGAMVIALKTARAASCRLCLCSINSDIDALLDLTDTHSLFEIYPDQAALEAALVSSLRGDRKHK